jgi:NADPH-dependent 2,4-dienoyl-CoA reductase/sulfur reductase-like enzyme
VVDEHFLASARVAAIGDVARFRWTNSSGSESVRIEHWEVANGHAQALAKYWMNEDPWPQLMVPYFWSDQYGKKIQLLGHPHPDDDVQRVIGSDEDGKWLALYSRNGVVTGLVTLNDPRALVLSRPLLEDRVALIPFTKLESSRIGSPVALILGVRRKIFRHMTVISRRARCVPKQKCGPGAPKP